MMTNQKGFSLIQVIILAGIGTIISAIVSTIALNTAKTANTIEGRTNLKIFHEMVNDVLTSPEGCQVQGGSVPFNTSLAQTPAGPATGNVYPSATSNPGLPMTFDFSNKNLGQNVGEGYITPANTTLKMKINYFRIHNARLLGDDPSNAGSQLYTADLWMQANRTSEGFGSDQIKVRSIGALTLSVSGGAIRKCSKVSSHPFVQCGVQGKIYVGPPSANTPPGIVPDANGCAPVANFAAIVVGPPTFGPPTFGPPTFGPPAPGPGPGPGPKPSDIFLKQNLKKFNDVERSRP